MSENKVTVYTALDLLYHAIAEGKKGGLPLLIGFRASRDIPPDKTNRDESREATVSFCFRDVQSPRATHKGLLRTASFIDPLRAASGTGRSSVRNGRQSTHSAWGAAWAAPNRFRHIAGSAPGADSCAGRETPGRAACETSDPYQSPFQN